MKLHFCGIGGSGMASLAVLASNMGLAVSGSDTSKSYRLDAIKEITTQLYDTHRQENVWGADVVVTSLAVPADNIEIQEAHKRSIPVWTRTECLGFLLTGKNLIAVTGSFGKSSTTSVLSDCFMASGAEPTVYLGARSRHYGLGARKGDSDYAIVEACEYKNEFLLLKPRHLIVLNLHINHEDFFGYDRIKLTHSFECLIAQNYHALETLWLPEDDIGSLPLLRTGHPNIKTYGLPTSEWYTECTYNTHSEMSEVALYHHGVKVAEYTTGLIGRHTIRNLAPVLGLCHTLGFSSTDIGNALSVHTPLARRFERVIESERLTMIDDNARLPQQVEMTVSAAKGIMRSGGKLIGVLGIWGRLNKRNLVAYAGAVAKCDVVFVMPSSGFETVNGGLEPVGADLLLCNAINAGGGHGVIYDEPADIAQYLTAPQTLVLTMGYDGFTSQFMALGQYLMAHTAPKHNLLVEG